MFVGLKFINSTFLQNGFGMRTIENIRASLIGLLFKHVLPCHDHRHISGDHFGRSFEFFFYCAPFLFFLWFFSGAYLLCAWCTCILSNKHHTSNGHRQARPRSRRHKTSEQKASPACMLWTWLTLHLQCLADDLNDHDVGFEPCQQSLALAGTLARDQGIYLSASWQDPKELFHQTALKAEVHS